jgi:hypothetical protein
VADDWLQPQSPVMVVEVDGDRRAYPLAIMTQHEIVNDVVSGEPLVMTYGPLCNSGLAFERTVEGEVLDFAPRAGCSRPTSSCTTGRHELSGPSSPDEPWSVRGSSAAS